MASLRESRVYDNSGTNNNEILYNTTTTNNNNEIGRLGKERECKWQKSKERVKEHHQINVHVH